MKGRCTRRGAIAGGATALLAMVAGCSQSSGDGSGGGTTGTDQSGEGGQSDGFDVVIENTTVQGHELALLAQTEFGEEVFYDETTEVEGKSTKTLSNVVSEPVEQVLSVKMDAAIDGETDRQTRRWLSDIIRIDPESESAPSDGLVRLLIRKARAKGPSEKVTVVDLTYEGRPTETQY